MGEDRPSRSSDLLILAVISVRVFFILLIWLTLFLGMFLGYFTVPIILVSALTIFYAISDIGIYVAVNRHAQARARKGEFLSSQKITSTEASEGLNNNEPD